MSETNDTKPVAAPETVEDDDTIEPLRVPPALAVTVIVFALLLPLAYLVLKYATPPPSASNAAPAAQPAQLSDSDREVTIAAALINQAQYDAASKLLDDVLSREPNNGIALNNKCVVYMMQHEVEKAVPICRRAVAAAPDLQLAKNNLNWALDEEQKLKK